MLSYKIKNKFTVISYFIIFASIICYFNISSFMLFPCILFTLGRFIKKYYGCVISKWGHIPKLTYVCVCVCEKSWKTVWLFIIFICFPDRASAEAEIQQQPEIASYITNILTSVCVSPMINFGTGKT